MSSRVSSKAGASTRKVRNEVVQSNRTVRQKKDKAPLLRPFFSYYGGKWRDALRLYPEPKFTTIVEPFAGSAGYSLRHHHGRKVILWERDPTLVRVWRFLIKAKRRDILAIPDLEPGQSVDDMKGVGPEARLLVGFWLNRGAASPRKSPSRWMRDLIRPGSFWGERVRQTIANQVDLIRDWEIHEGDYTECSVQTEATWFVDPPYEQAGQYYRYGADQLDYKALAEWCRKRPGQVIVCENAGADWLPFSDPQEVKTTRAARRSKEVHCILENGVVSVSQPASPTEA
ncbi:site-specific DNA-adenine methylase [Archangium gephyra]|uniref:Site-specific DNA-adenine methylase n=1 Tax=Archangium gephyra TaxID=48 RepID=A0AAC8TJQ4_9BACT|nr:hypothetical protein [Archangium gephyra]AKJ06961.1 Hypothetical protein AA314_08587 [Archangium gephyra]REG31751.1 site-specific DNA-adenine methylase [Archangium gephyra]